MRAGPLHHSPAQLGGTRYGHEHLLHGSDLAGSRWISLATHHEQPLHGADFAHPRQEHEYVAALARVAQGGLDRVSSGLLQRPALPGCRRQGSQARTGGHGLVQRVWVGSGPPAI